MLHINNSTPEAPKTNLVIYVPICQVSETIVISLLAMFSFPDDGFNLRIGLEFNVI